ncbi:MAG: agmatinase [Candidatus Zixiibacteriota bacterium]
MSTGLKINCGDLSEANIVLLGVPYDQTASYRKGTAGGPKAIINSLEYQMETYDRYSQRMPSPSRMVGLQILTDINGLSPADMVARVRKEYGKHIINDAFVLLIGGEHSVSTGVFQALADHRNSKNITIFQIDAHLDLRPDDSDYSDTPHGEYAHCTPMRRGHELGFKCVQVGIRAYSKEEMDYAIKNKLAVFEWGIGKTPTVSEIVNSIDTNQVYVTIDVDGLDPSIMPATGTPVQGGLEWYFTIDLLRELFRRKEIIGADIVEVAPRPNDVVTEYGAAQLAYTMLALREK